MFGSSDYISDERLEELSDIFADITRDDPRLVIPYQTASTLQYDWNSERVDIDGKKVSAFEVMVFLAVKGRRAQEINENNFPELFKIRPATLAGQFRKIPAHMPRYKAILNGEPYREDVLHKSGDDNKFRRTIISRTQAANASRRHAKGEILERSLRQSGKVTLGQNAALFWGGLEKPKL